MNRNFKVVWNRSLGCFTAVAEYAKSRGKSSSTTVASGVSVSVTGGAPLLRLSALCIGLAAAGFNMQSVAAYQAGPGASATGSNSLALGDNAKATAGQSIAIGGAGNNFTTAIGDQSIAIGANARSEGDSSIAIGGDDLDSASKANVDGSTTGGALNSGTVNAIFKDISGRDLVDATNNTTRYPTTKSSSAASVAVGVQAVSGGALSTAFGTQSNSSGVASAAFGVSASASKDGSVAIGAGASTLTDATSVTSATVNGITYGNFAGSADIDAGDQVSVGSAGRERQIKSVAAGAITATSTDAVNGSQLFSVARTISSAQPVVYTNAAGTRVYKQANGNFTTNPDGTGTTVANNNVQTSILAANGTTNTPTKLTNVAAGAINAGSTDAVNGSQLNTTNTKVANNTTALGGSYNAAGVYTPPVYNVVADPSSATTTPFNTVKGAVEQLSGAVQTPLTFTGDNTGTTVTRKLGQSLNVKGGATAANLTENNIGVVASTTDNSLAVKLNKNLDLTDTGSVKTGNSLLNNTGLTITGGPSVTATGIDAGTKQINNVVAGTAATDAANVAQVTGARTIVAAGNNVASVTKTTATNGQDTYTVNANGSKITAGSGAVTITETAIANNVTQSAVDLSADSKASLVRADNSVQYDNAGKTSVTLGGGADGTTLTNLKAGVNAKDAVNVTQLNTVSTAANRGINVTTAQTGTGTVTGTSVAQVATGETATFTAGNNIAITQAGKEVQIAVSATPTFTSVTTGNSVLNNTGLTIAGGANPVSLTNTGLNNGNNKITNVANGDIVANSKDAINGGQVNTLVNAVTDQINTTNANVTDNTNRSQGNTTALGGSYDATTGDYTAPEYNVVANPSSATTTSFNTVKGAVETLSGAIQTPLTFTGNVLNDTDANGSQQKLGSTLNISGGAAATTASSNANVKTVVTDGNIDIQLVDAPTFTGQVKANGFDASNAKIVNVANGTNDADAVNLGQLNTATNAATNSAPVVYTQADGTQVYRQANGDFNTAADGTGTVVAPANIITSIRSADGSTTTATKLTNVAPGTIGTGSTDAVNGSQLNTTNTRVANNTTALGGSYDATTGDYTAPEYNVVANPSSATTTSFNTVKGAVETLSGAIQTPLTFTGNTGTTNRKLGETLAITGNGNLSTVSSASGVAINLSDTPTFTSVTTGNSVLNNTGLTIANGANPISLTNTGLNNGNNKIVNVADGTATTDAVNVGQLNTATNSATNTAPVVYTQADGTQVYKQANGDFNTAVDGTGTAVTPANIITSIRSADGSTTTATKLSNVAAGTIGASSTDAINGSQLNTIAQGNKTLLGGNATVNTNGVVTSTNIGGTGSNTIDGAISAANTQANKALTFTGNVLNDTDTNGSQQKLGSTLNISGGATAASSNANVKTVVTDGNIDIQFVDAPTFTGQVKANGFDASNAKIVNVADGTDNSDAVNLGQLNTATNSATNSAPVVYTNADGIQVYRQANGDFNTAADGTGTVVIPANIITSIRSADGSTTTATKLSNVAAGAISASSTDAVNGSQLNTIAQGNKTLLGGGATVDANGVVSSTNIGGTNETTIDGAISAANTQANKSLTFTGDSGTTDRKLGETLAITGDSNLSTTSSASGIAISLNPDLNVDSVTATDGDDVTTLTATGTNVTDGTNTSNYGAEGLTITGGPSITKGGIDAGGSTITNLKDGVNADDAATFGQLSTITDNITAAGVQYDRNTNDTVNYDQVSFAGTPAVIGKDKNDNNIVVSGGTTLTNVANGINASDAVNKGQLDSVTKVKVFDKNGDEITVNIADQVVNNNVNNNDLESLFLTYNKEGQEVTDRLTIGETVQKMNTEGVKFAHTNASPQSKGDIASGVTNDSSAGGLDSTAIGVNAIITEKGKSSVALGHNTLVAGESSIAIGDGAQANGTQSISIGTGNIVNGDNSGAFGDPSTINGNNSYSVGNNNTINSDDTFVLGNGVTANQNGSVILGTGSMAATGAGILGFGATGNAAITATTSTTGAVAVGDAADGVYRQITGVAAGTADSDAVNVSQLKAVNDKIDNNNTAINDAAVQYDKNQDDTVNKGSITLGGAAGTTITNVADGVQASDAVNKGQLDKLGSGVAGIIGGDTKYDENGNLTATNIGGTGKGNISDAIAAVNQGNAQANEDIQANSEDIQANTDRLDSGLSFGADSGDNVNKSIGDSTAVNFQGGNNITTSTTDGGIQIGLDGNISVDSVTTGNTVINNSGVTIKDGPSMTANGIDAGGKTITGVADGVEVNDAVNLGQLNALDSKLSNSVNDLGYKIGEVEDDANAGISAAMAMSSLPQAYIPGKSMVGGGVATYNGESAVAIGVSRVSDNGRWVMKINGTADTQGNAGGAIGAGFHF